MARAPRARSVTTMCESLKAVTDIMRSGVVSVSRSTSLEGVGRAMREHGVHGVLVVDDHDGELLGWVTARSLLLHHGSDWTHHTAGQAISESCICVVPSASVTEAINAMLDANATRLAVVRPGSQRPTGSCRPSTSSRTWRAEHSA